MTIQATYYIHWVPGGVAIVDDRDNVKAIGPTEKQAFEHLYSIATLTRMEFNLDSLRQARRHARNGSKIEAIKELRQHIPMGLREAKAFAEFLAEDHETVSTKNEYPTLGDILESCLKK